MALRLSEFTGKFKGGARPNLFKVAIAEGPSYIQDVNENMEILGQGASLPAATIGEIIVPYMGRQHKIPGNRTFDNLSITVLNDENMDIRNDFEFWMGQFNSHEYNDSTYSAGNSGMGTFVITHNNREMSSGGDKKWEFVNVFPIALGEIGLDWGSNDTIEEFTVDLAYDYWQSDFVA